MPNSDGYGVEALLERLRPTDAEGKPTDRRQLCDWMLKNAIREQRVLNGMMEDGTATVEHARTVGRLWGASHLSARAVLWDRDRYIVPPRPHKRGEPFHRSQISTEWVVSAALVCTRQEVDGLDQELFELATATQDPAAMVTWWKLRGALEIAAAWRADAAIDDRHVVPVSTGDDHAVLHEAPRGVLRARVEALLDEALNEGMAAASGDGSAADRLRAADMATGRAQAYRLVLSLLPVDEPPTMVVLDDLEDDDRDNEGLGETCEGCPDEAVTRDSMGVPLCRPCYDALPLLDDEPGDDVTDNSAYRREDGHAP